MHFYMCVYTGFSGSSPVKNPVQEMWSSNPGVREDLLEEGVHSVFLPGECMDRRAWQATVRRVAEYGHN